MSTAALKRRLRRRARLVRGSAPWRDYKFAGWRILKANAAVLFGLFFVSAMIFGRLAANDADGRFTAVWVALFSCCLISWTASSLHRELCQASGTLFLADLPLDDQTIFRKVFRHWLLTRLLMVPILLGLFLIVVLKPASWGAIGLSQTAIVLFATGAQLALIIGAGVSLADWRLSAIRQSTNWLLSYVPTVLFVVSPVMLFGAGEPQLIKAIQAVERPVTSLLPTGWGARALLLFRDGAITPLTCLWLIAPLALGTIAFITGRRRLRESYQIREIEFTGSQPDSITTERDYREYREYLVGYFESYSAGTETQLTLEQYEEQVREDYANEVEEFAPLSPDEARERMQDDRFLQQQGWIGRVVQQCLTPAERRCYEMQTDSLGFFPYWTKRYLQAALGLATTVAVLKISFLLGVNAPGLGYGGLLAIAIVCATLWAAPVICLVGNTANLAHYGITALELLPISLDTQGRSLMKPNLARIGLWLPVVVAITMLATPLDGITRSSALSVVAKVAILVVAAQPFWVFLDVASHTNCRWRSLWTFAELLTGLPLLALFIWGVSIVFSEEGWRLAGGGLLTLAASWAGWKHLSLFYKHGPNDTMQYKEE